MNPIITSHLDRILTTFVIFIVCWFMLCLDFLLRNTELFITAFTSHQLHNLICIILYNLIKRFFTTRLKLSDFCVIKMFVRNSIIKVLKNYFCRILMMLKWKLNHVYSPHVKCIVPLSSHWLHSQTIFKVVFTMTTVVSRRSSVNPASSQYFPTLQQWN